MPSIDISLPGGGAGGDVDVEGPAGKGRKFEMPKFDVSLPKLKPSEVKSMLKPRYQGWKVSHALYRYLSTWGGAGGDVDVEGPAGKGRKFEMPKFDVSLPN